MNAKPLLGQHRECGDRSAFRGVEPDSATLCQPSSNLRSCELGRPLAQPALPDAPGFPLAVMVDE